jgi:hypothetical protein
MSSSLAAAERLERVAKVARTAGSRDAIEIAEIFEAWRRGEIVDLPAALGLKPAVGERDPRSQLSLAKRDEIIRDAFQRFLADASSAEAARQFCSGLQRYRSSAWKSERKSADLPERHRGKISAAYWSVLKVIDHVPSERTVRRMLATKGGDFVAVESRDHQSNNGEPHE